MINQRDENGIRHGPWEDYYNNGQLWLNGEYNHGKNQGLWELYYTDGETMGKGGYKNHKERGLWYQSRHTK